MFTLFKFLTENKDIFSDLEKLGWFNLTLTQYRNEAENVLRERLETLYVDTTGFAEDHALLKDFQDKNLTRYPNFSLDFRVFSDDPEELSESDVSRVLNLINETFKLRDDKLFDSCSDKVETESCGHSVLIDGDTFVVYAENDIDNYNWGTGVNVVLKIVNSLLDKKNNPNRLYFSWDGCNNINFFLLTKPLYNYISTNKIDGGLGPIVENL